LDTLQVPIQTPVSPDEKWVATAVLSLTNVVRPGLGSADHVAIIDTATDKVVKFVPVPAGAHGVNWGAKRGGGYYAYVTCQHSNAMVVIDPDPNGDSLGNDARVVGRVILSNGSLGAGVTDGTGGQGVKPLPLTHDGWIQPTVSMRGTGELSAEVEGWLNLLTPEQRDPSQHQHFANSDRVGVSHYRLASAKRLGGGIPQLAAGEDEKLRFVSHKAAGAVELSVEGYSPRMGAKELEFAVESSTNRLGVPQRVEMFDYTTARWVSFAKGATSRTDARLVVQVDDRPERFIHRLDRKMRARITWQSKTGRLQCAVDHVYWTHHG
ncbi:MAG TPA: hypothetical protein VGE01_08475, partial [Fimbriimonas sp.]